MTDEQLVKKVWNFAHVLRDDGVSSGDYIAQITYLLFLKMDQERLDEYKGYSSDIPMKYRWEKLVNKDGEALQKQYRETLEALGNKRGLIGKIFSKAENKISTPARLKRIVSLIDSETWIGLDVDVKGEIYEGLLERTTSEVKSGAGQYFTPRPVIEAIVKCINPKISDTVCDPACGTGGFLLAAYNHMKTKSADKRKSKKLKESFTGVDIDNQVVRLCAMNLYLHGIGNGGSPVTQGDALQDAGRARYNIVVTNPPFGTRSGHKAIGEDGNVSIERESYEREDFRFTTSNKQFNFLQHIMTILETNGRAGVVMPDNVLFEGKGAGMGIRKRLLESFNFHTLLRLPTGIWYSPGVKANVLFFDKRPPASKGHQTKELWIYDYRTNIDKTLKEKRLTREDMQDFIDCYQGKPRKETERFKRFTYEEIVQRDNLNLNISWLKGDNLESFDNLPEPDILSAEIVENLETALEQFRSVNQELSDKE